jgi:hypothetical protein
MNILLVSFDSPRPDVELKDLGNPRRVDHNELIHATRLNTRLV